MNPKKFYLFTIPLLLIGIFITVNYAFTHQIQIRSFLSLSIGRLPNKDIVFKVDRPNIIGFMNSDGSGFEEINIGGIATPINWSEGGTFLNLRALPPFPDSGGYPFMISSIGKIYYCPELEADKYYLHFKSLDNLQIILVKYQEEPNRVVLYDMKTCKGIKTIYTAFSDDLLREVTLSSQQSLAIEKQKSTQGQGILVLQPNGSDNFFLKNASFPAWSKDGEWLAFGQGSDSQRMMLNVIRKDGTEQKELGVIVSDTPSWSPDGNWLVYERFDDIYRFEITTGNEMKIYENGVSPDWRWNNP